ncbi:ATP-dependent DNA ligase, partial [Curtobacterium sp. CT11-133]
GVPTAWCTEARGEHASGEYTQANRDRTMAGAYSPRALAHAAVSTPIAWDELDDADPTAFTIRSVPERLRTAGAPWQAMHA